MSLARALPEQALAAEERGGSQSISILRADSGTPGEHRTIGRSRGAWAETEAGSATRSPLNQDGRRLLVTERDPLDDEPFTYLETKDGRVRIFYHGKIVTTLADSMARKFGAQVAAAGPREAQMAMAKATGHFKHGNERQGRERG